MVDQVRCVGIPFEAVCECGDWAQQHPLLAMASQYQLARQYSRHMLKLELKAVMGGICEMARVSMMMPARILKVMRGDGEMSSG